MPHACFNDFGGNWDNHLPLVEFDNNNNYHSIIHIVPQYVNKRQRPLEFKVGDMVILKVSPRKDLFVFRKK